MKKILLFFVLLAAVFCGFNLCVHASVPTAINEYLTQMQLTELYSNYDAPTKQSDAGIESISGASGGVNYEQTDLVLPGKGGLDLKLTRRINTAQPMGRFGVPFGVQVIRSIGIGAIGTTQKYVFCYYVNGNTASEPVYVAYDTVQDMLTAENGSNQLTVASDYASAVRSLAKGYLQTGDLAYYYELPENEIGLDVDDQFFLYAELPTGNDITLVRAVTENYVPMDFKSIFTYDFRTTSLASARFKADMWCYDVACLDLLSRTTTYKDSNYKDLLCVYSFYDSEEGTNIRIDLDYHIKLANGKAYVDQAKAYSLTDSNRLTSNMYTVNAVWPDQASGLTISITRYDGKIFTFHGDTSTRLQLASIKDKFNNIITVENYHFIDTLGRDVYIGSNGIQVNGTTVVEFERIVTNNAQVDPNNHLSEDDVILFNVKYTAGSENGKTIGYEYQLGNLKYNISSNQSPHVSTAFLYNYRLNKIKLSTGGEICYAYQYENECMPYATSIIREACRLSSRYERISADGTPRSKINYTYDLNNVENRGYTMTYDGLDGYSAAEWYDKDGYPTKRIEESTQAGNAYHIQQDYTFTQAAEGVKLLTQLTTTTKVDSSSAANTVVESYEYNNAQQRTSTTRDGVVIETASYSPKGVLLTHFKKRDDSGRMYGTSNNLWFQIMIYASYTARLNENGSITKFEKTSYDYSSNGDISLVQKAGVTTNISYAYADYTTADITAPSLVKTYTVSNVSVISGTADTTTAQAVVRTETYDWLGRLISETDGKGNVTSYTYDGYGRVTQVTNPDQTSSSISYNDTLNEVIAIDETGRKEKVTFDAAGYPEGGWLYNGTAWKKAFEREYDAAGRLAAEKALETDGTEKGRVAYTYYADGSLASETAYEQDTLISKRAYQYAPYYAENQRRTVTRVYSSASGYADVEQYTDKYGYKTADYVRYGTTLLQQTYTTDLLGNIVSYKDFKANAENAAANTASYTYDHANRLLTETTADGTVTNTYNSTTGLLTSTKDRRGYSTLYTYDAMGRLASETRPLNASQNSVTRYYYDANGNLAQTKQSLDGTNYIVTKNLYNSRNMLTDVITRPDSTDVVTKYVYDAAGRVIQRAEGLTSVSDTISPASHRVTAFSYDAYGNPASETDPMGKTKTYSYNLLGQLVHETDKNGTVTTYAYDLSSQLLSKAYTTADGETDSVSYTYDLLGNVTSMLDKLGTTTYTYDRLGNLLTETAGATVKTYTYDANGNRASFQLSVGGETKQSAAYTYSLQNRLTAMTEGSRTTAYTYDANGSMLTEQVKENGTQKLRTTYTYNYAGLPTAKKVMHGTNTAVESYTMAYDLAGNIVTVTGGGETTSYTYDGANRLTGESYSTGGSISYTYDRFNNRVGMTKGGTTVSYAYDKNNRLTASTETAGNTVSKYAYYYDHNGNLISRTKDEVQSAQSGTEGNVVLSVDSSPYLNTYAYDGWNRLTSANTGGILASYAYRGNNLRESKTVTADGTAKTTSFVYDGMDIVYDTDGTEVHSYVRGASGLLYSVSGGTATYYRTNFHGDVSALANSSGTATQTYKYDSFGNEWTESTSANPFRYNGEYYDEETGFIYLRNRFYDPGTGRFISEDPIHDGVNWYAYCGNNPVMFADPLGLEYGKLRDFVESYYGAFNGHIEIKQSTFDKKGCAIVTLGDGDNKYIRYFFYDGTIADYNPATRRHEYTKVANNIDGTLYLQRSVFVVAMGLTESGVATVKTSDVFYVNSSQAMLDFATNVKDSISNGTDAKDVYSLLGKVPELGQSIQIGLTLANLKNKIKNNEILTTGNYRAESVTVYSPYFSAYSHEVNTIYGADTDTSRYQWSEENGLLWGWLPGGKSWIK